MIDRLELMSTGPSRQFSIITIITITIILAFFFAENDFLTTVSNAEVAGQPDNVCIISPSCHIDKEVMRVPYGESKCEPFYTDICR